MKKNEKKKIKIQKLPFFLNYSENWWECRQSISECKEFQGLKICTYQIYQPTLFFSVELAISFYLRKLYESRTKLIRTGWSCNCSKSVHNSNKKRFPLETTSLFTKLNLYIFSKDFILMAGKIFQSHQPYHSKGEKYKF